jgi:PRTRC genetic system ThiF family protein
MNNDQTAVHIVEKYLLSPPNPIVVTLIGAGGTGSQVLTSLSKINTCLIALGHPGLFVKVIDDDTVTRANMGRQLFTTEEIGLKKSVALVNRINRFFGTNWKAIPEKVTPRTDPDRIRGNVIITCVDSAKVRFMIAKILKGVKGKSASRDQPFYWLDFGNNQNTGQVILSTIGNIKQPESSLYKTVQNLPFITDEYKTLLQSVKDDDLPSCSLAEALTKQDLFINTSLCALGSSLLWSMFREGIIKTRGFFLNLKEFRTQPIPVN